MVYQEKYISYAAAVAAQKKSAAIIDKCYLRVGIALLPWNRKRGV